MGYRNYQPIIKNYIMREALIGQNSCTGMHTGLETEWFITLSRPIRIENKIKERMVNYIGK